MARCSRRGGRHRPLLAHRLGSRSSAIRHTRTPDPGAHLSDDSMHTQPAELGTERESVMEDWRISTAGSRHRTINRPWHGPSLSDRPWHGPSLSDRSLDAPYPIPCSFRPAKTEVQMLSRLFHRCRPHSVTRGRHRRTHAVWMVLAALLSWPWPWGRWPWGR